MKKYKQFLGEITPLFIALLLQPFIHGELAYTLVIAVLLLVSLHIKYYKGEWTLFVFGAIIGFVFEALAGLVYRMQYWVNASLLGIPFWLPIFYGYAFIFIHRFGRLIVKK